jgi:hypothetical protein
LPYPTISAWKQRGSIPAAYWRDIVRAAKRRGHPEITADLLAELHARKSPREMTGGFAEEDAAPIMSQTDTPKTAIERLPGSGHFSRWKHLRRSHFASPEDIGAHIDALRAEWSRR